MVHRKDKRIHRKQLDESIKDNRIAHLPVCLLREHTASKDTGKIALPSNIMIAFNYPCGEPSKQIWVGRSQNSPATALYRLTTLAAMAHQDITCPPIAEIAYNRSACSLCGPISSKTLNDLNNGGIAPRFQLEDGGLISTSINGRWSCSITKVTVKSTVFLESGMDVPHLGLTS